MDRPRQFVLCLLALLVAAGCGRTASESSTQPAAPAAPRPAVVQVRLTNAGKVPLENIRVNFQGQIVDYGTLPPGMSSAYVIVAKTYSYARIDATVAGKPALLQPEDFVGETLLTPGQYSWTLTGSADAAEPTGRLQLQGSKRDEP